MKRSKTILYAGDVFAILITTFIGFATHGEADLAYLPRFLAAFVPLTFAWFLLAPWFGLFQPEITSDLKQLWRVPLVVFFAAPLAVVARGFILNGAVLPVFAIIFGATSALGMIVWRAIWCQIT